MHGATVKKSKSLINYIASKSQSGKYFNVMGGNKGREQQFWRVSLV
jgi:hypothetical protein